ncbi:hypothetical protein LI7559_13340 [Bacillus licheniformis LMG 7559]|nr:hypothetical protein LI7559_13340 [Bacillus licheniformis LMG 7559]
MFTKSDLEENKKGAVFKRSPFASELADAPT